MGRVSRISKCLTSARHRRVTHRDISFFGRGGRAGVLGSSLAALVAALVSAPARARASTEIAIIALDAAGKRLDTQRSNASIQRTPPEAGEVTAIGSSFEDPDAVRFVVVGNPGDLPRRIEIVASSPQGAEIDKLTADITEVPCPGGLAPSCRATSLIRTVGDDIDQNHPLVKGRSIRGEIGGGLTVTSPAGGLLSLRVGGPRSSPIGPLPRVRGRLRLIVVRRSSQGFAPVRGRRGGGQGAGTSPNRSRQRALGAVWHHLRPRGGSRRAGGGSTSEVPARDRVRFGPTGERGSPTSACRRA